MLIISMLCAVKCVNQPRKETSMKTLCIALLASISIASLQAKDGLKTIEIIPSKIETGDLKLSNLITSIEYIPLETTDECLIGNIGSYDISEKYILVYCRQGKTLALFDRKGKFLRTISRHGQGPEEFISIKGLKLDEQKNLIIINDIVGIKFFDLQGKFLRTSTLHTGPDFQLQIDESRLFSCFPGSVKGDSVYPIYRLFDISGKQGLFIRGAVQSVPLDTKVKAGEVAYIGIPSMISQYRYKGQVCMKDNAMNDTLYTFGADYRVVPKCIITAGKLAYTKEMKSDYNLFLREQESHLGFYSTYETDLYYLLAYLYRRQIKYCFVDKRDGAIKHFNSSKGIPNDYNGGFDFSFHFNVRQNNNVWTTFYNAEQFAERKDLSTIKPVGPKAAVDRFKSLCNTLAVDDNPVLMIVNLK